MRFLHYYLLLFVLLFSCKSERVGNEPQERLNVIFILADDLGIGDLTCYNAGSKINTQNLDQLAAESLQFMDGHSGSAVCTPTRYGILTGRYAWRTELKSGVLWPYDPPLIENDRLTMADLFKSKGYSTACIGKWHLGWDWPIQSGKENVADSLLNAKLSNNDNRAYFSTLVDFKGTVNGGPVDCGFDYYFGDDVPNFPPYVFFENEKLLGHPTIDKPKSMFGHPGKMLEGWDLAKVMPALQQKSKDFISNEIDLVSREKDQPFFLYLPLTAPHTPIAPIEEFHGKSGAGFYGDYVLQVDHMVGEIVKTLKEKGLYDNTIIVFTSDNGSPGKDGTDMSGEYRSVLAYGHNPSWVYRGTKADIYEGGHRIPLLVRWPGKKVGEKTNSLACLNDFYATFAHLLGIDLQDNAGEDSFDMTKVFEATENSDYQYRENLVNHSIQGCLALRTADGWKYEDCGGSGGWSEPNSDKEIEKLGLPSKQLYNLKEDKGEVNNLIQGQPDKAQELNRILASIVNSPSSRVMGSVDKVK